MNRSVIVLWEDKLGRRRDFGPDRLLKACVGDALDRSWATIAHVSSRPMNGSGNVVRSLRQDHEDLTRGGALLIAVLDADQAWRAVGCKRDATDAELVTAIFPGGTPTDVHVLILRENLETVRDQLIRCAEQNGQPIAAHHREKSLNARDELFGRSLGWTASVRRCLVDSVPAFAALVALVAEVVR